MHQPNLFVRVGVLASSLALVTGFIAYRTGYLSTPQRLVSEQPVDPLFLNAIEGGVPLPPSDDELVEIGNSNVTHQEMNGLEPDAGTAQSPWIAADNSHSKNRTVQDFLVASAAGATDSMTAPPVQSIREPVYPSKRSVQSQPSAVTAPPAVISSSKSIVLLDAKSVLQKAEEPVTAKEKSYEAKMYQAAKLAFTERDRNRDGRLSQDELGEKTWKKLQEQKLVENGSVDVNGFSKVFIQLADQ